MSDVPAPAPAKAAKPARKIKITGFDFFSKPATPADPHWPDGKHVAQQTLTGPDGRVFFHHAVGGRPKPEEVAVVESDASYQVHKLGKVAGLGWRLTMSGKAYVPQRATRQRYDGSSQMAEAHAAVGGLEQALSKGAEHVLLKTDAQTVVRYLAGNWRPDEEKYSREVYDELLTLVKKFKSVQVEWTRTKQIKTVDKEARVAKDEKMKALDMRWTKFLASVEKAMARGVANKIRVTSKDVRGVTFYHWVDDTKNGYSGTVGLNPTTCTCLYGQKKFNKAYSKNPRATSPVCLHVGAVLHSLGLSPEEAAEALHGGSLSAFKKIKNEGTIFDLTAEERQAFGL